MATISSYKTRNGETRYRVRYRTPKRKQTDKRGFRTKRDAERFAATVEVAKMRGEYIPPTLGRITVEQLGPAWLERQKGHMKPSGFRSYESAWRVHVQPRWGHTRVSDIRFTAVQAWVSQLATTRGPVVVQTAYSVLARTLDDAVRDGLLASNPVRNVKLPKRPPRRNCISPPTSSTNSPTRRAATGRWCCSSGLEDCAGAKRLRCGLVMWTSCADASSCTATPCRYAPRSSSARSRGTRTAWWCCRSSSSTRWPRPPRARVEMICCGRRRRAATLGHPVKGVLAIRCGCPLPKGRPGLPAVDGSCAAAHGRVAGDQRRGESKSGPADVWASAAMTLDVFANLYDSDLTSVRRRVVGQNVGTKR